MADSSLESPPNGICLFRCFFVVLTFRGREAAIQLEGKRKVAPYLVAPSRRRARNTVQIVVFAGGPLLETTVPSRRNCSLKAKLSVSIVFLSSPPSTFLPSRWKAGSHCFFRRTGFCRRTPFMNNRLFRCFFVVRFFCACGRGKGDETQMEDKRKGSLFLVAPKRRRPWTTVQIVFDGGPL